VKRARWTTPDDACGCRDAETIGRTRKGSAVTNILFNADDIGSPGRDVVQALRPGLKQRHDVHLVICNGENAAGGFGLTRDTAAGLFDAGIDVLTGGNHLWDRKEALTYLGEEPRLVRPANMPAGTPGQGGAVFTATDGTPVGVVSMLGQVFMREVDSPFRTIDAVLEPLRRKTKVIFVDFHAEATAEKVALGWHLDGRVSAVIGTHTHTQTADERILAGGTACLPETRRNSHSRQAPVHQRARLRGLRRLQRAVQLHLRRAA
jgi:metallophosphoesterase (TIGR00282 family)